MEEPKNFSEEYVKELREEAKQWRLKLRETENKLKELQEEFAKKELSYQKELEKLNEELKNLDNLKKEVEIYKPKAINLEEKIRNDLLSKIQDEELRKQALEKFQDLEQLEFFVNSLTNVTKIATKSSMDNTQKSIEASVETEYIKAMQSGDVLRAIAIKNKKLKAS